MAKSNDLTLLLKTNLKHLRLPTMLAEFEKLAREASAGNEDYQQYLLRLTELELATRGTNALRARIKQAAFPVEKDFDTFDFSVTESLPKQKILELARGEWIDRNENVCLIGSAGTGEDSRRNRTGPGCLPARATRPLLHRRHARQSPGGSAETVPTRSLPDWTGQGGPADLRRTGLSFVQPSRCRAVVPSVRGSLRTGQPVDHQQPALQRMEPSVPRRTDDGGVVGSSDSSLSHLRDEWRKLPLPSVDERKA